MQKNNAAVWGSVILIALFLLLIGMESANRSTRCGEAIQTGNPEIVKAICK